MAWIDCYRSSVMRQSNCGKTQPSIDIPQTIMRFGIVWIAAYPLLKKLNFFLKGLYFFVGLQLFFPRTLTSLAQMYLAQQAIRFGGARIDENRLPQPFGSFFEFFIAQQ